MRKLLISNLLLFLGTVACWGQAGTTVVTAQVKDTNGSLYVNCQWSVVFVGENTTPGAGPYAPAALLNGQQGHCDSQGNFSVNLADNINTITPTPSQWSFSICSAPGYPQGPFCKSNILVTISTATQDLTSLFTPLMPLLPTTGSGGTIVFPGVPTGSCTSPQTAVNQSNGDFYSCVGGAWQKVGPGASAGNPGGSPFSVQTNVSGVSFGGTSIGRNQFLAGTTGAPIAQNKAVYDARDWGLVCDGATNDTGAVTTLLTAIGSTQAVIKIPFTQPCLLGSVSFPANVTLDFGNGGAIKNVIDNTAPGGATFVQGAGTVNAGATASNSCSVTLSGTAAGNTIVMLVEHAFTGVTDTSPTDGTNFYAPLLQQGFNFSTVVSSYAASSIAGGNVTITAPLASVVQNACIAWEFHGAGIAVGLNAGLAGVEANPGTLTMTSGAITTTTGALIINYGGNRRFDEVCTPNAGYTLPAGSAGSVGGVVQPGPTDIGESLCAEYLLAGPGGSVNPTLTITNDPLSIPLNRYWADSTIALIPKSAFIQVLGGIINDNLHQIFYNALPGQGTIDFTGNLAIQKVFPEWWGASSTAAAATNTPAIQAAIYGAYGTNRINGGGNNQYNKELHFSQGVYNINDELKAYHWIGFKVTGECRLCTSINQTAVNKRIIDGQSNAYGEFASIGFTTTVAQDLTHPLVDLDYNAAQGSDLSPQFINFHDVNWNGASLASIGFQLAKSGGGSQGSNVYFYDNLASSFTEACYMIGSGSGGNSSLVAANAIAITWYGGDVQSCPAYGIENFGGQTLKIDGTTFENGFQTQTGYDVLCANLPAGGACEIDNVRSESRRLAAGSRMIVKHSYLQDQSFVIPAGNSPAVGTIIRGSSAGGDGRFYKVTVQGAMGGVSTEGAAVPLIASSGTGTTIVDTNQNVVGSVTQGAFANGSIGETMTQATTGSTGVRLNTPSSAGTITGSVTSGTIGASHTMTQATTGVTCTSQNAPTGTTSLSCNNFSGTADNSHIWTDGTTSGTYTPTAAPTFSSTTLIITAATGAPDNSHVWTGGTSGAKFTPTAVPVAQAAFTVNAFIGMNVVTAGVAGTAGAAKNQYCLITANTATDITCAAGWLTHIQSTTIANPSTSTIFWVEPNWGTTFTSGGATWVASDTYIFEGTQGGGGILIGDDLFLPGGRANLDSRSFLQNVRFTDLNWGGAPPEAEIVNYHFDNVMVPSLNNTNALFRIWRPSRQGITGLSNYAVDQKGTVPICWTAGQTSTNTATVDICVRPDPNGTGTKNGRLQLLNNSSGTTQTWSFNADGSTTFPGAITVATATNCAANGSAANPSLVACTAAAAGAFSCDVAASAGTCTVSTTAVTANSQINVWLVSDEGARLGVTCNTSPSAVPAIYVATKTAATSFVINMPTITTNPACFDYTITN